MKSVQGSGFRVWGLYRLGELWFEAGGFSRFRELLVAVSGDTASGATKNPKLEVSAIGGLRFPLHSVADTWSSWEVGGGMRV